MDEDGETEVPFPQITVEKADYLILMETLHKLFTIAKEEHGIRADDDRVLYVIKCQKEKLIINKKNDINFNLILH